MRVKITLRCNECKQRNYNTMKNKKNDPDRLEMKSELKKVVWPTKSQMINNTLIVLACVLVVGIFIWVFDAVGGVVVNGIITLVKG